MMGARVDAATPWGSVELGKIGAFLLHDTVLNMNHKD